MAKFKYHWYILKKDTQFFKEGDIVESIFSPDGNLKNIVVTNKKVNYIEPLCRCPVYFKELISKDDLIYLESIK